MSDQLSPSEALYGFIAWLSSRQQPITLGAQYATSGDAAKLIEEFCARNNLQPPREGWAKNLVHSTNKEVPVEKESPDFTNKVSSPFPSMDLFGASGVKVHFVGASGEAKTAEEVEKEGITMVCPRLQVPHLHKLGEDGGFHCTLPQTLEELGL